MRLIIFLSLFLFFPFVVHAQVNVDDRMSIDLETKFKKDKFPVADIHKSQKPDISVKQDNVASNMDNSKYSDEPVCGRVRNMASYSVMGSVATDYDILADGSRGRHRSNFRIPAGEFAEFCTKGPFYDGRRVELTIRTLVPIFSCYTKFDKEIVIIGSKKVDGSYETKAICE